MENSVIVAAQGMLKIQAECQRNKMRCTGRCAYFSHVVNYLRKVRKQPGGGCIVFDMWVDGQPPGRYGLTAGAILRTALVSTTPTCFAEAGLENKPLCGRS